MKYLLLIIPFLVGCGDINVNNQELCAVMSSTNGKKMQVSCIDGTDIFVNENACIVERKEK